MLGTFIICATGYGAALIVAAIGVCAAFAAKDEAKTDAAEAGKTIVGVVLLLIIAALMAAATRWLAGI